MELPPQPTETPIIPPTEPPRRHGCLTTWLILIIIGGLLALGTPFTMAALAEKTGQTISPALTWVLVLCGLANIGFAIALFRWMKIGFYGIVATTIISLIIYAMMGNIGAGLAGIVGVAILYWVLNMGGPNKAWPRLR